MAGRFRSIFRKTVEDIEAPKGDKPLMRVLEPRILLDAAAVETALDIAGQAAHSQLADDYAANTRPTDDMSGDEISSRQSDDAGMPDQATEAELEPGLYSRDSREIIFIDSRVDNIDDLKASFEPSVRTIILDAGEDGILQIRDALADGGPYDAVHVFSHGQSGVLQLGSTILDSAAIVGNQRENLAAIGSSLSEDADILIYGCDFGQGTEGEQAARLLAAATGADIAASDDLTGSESLAGDWDLEVRVGDVRAVSYTAPDWKGILGNFELSAVSDPLITHVSGGINGTPGTVAIWSNAVTHDPGGGAPVETYDVRATILGITGEASATFETVSTSNPTLDDFRVVVTNIGQVTGNQGGQDIREEGSVTVLWEITFSGTTVTPDGQDINLTITDIDGLVGLPQTFEGIGLELDTLQSVTQESTSNLQVTDDGEELYVDGTQNGNNDPDSKITANFVQANQILLTYRSHTLTTVFDMDGDGDVTYASPEVTLMQSLDLDADDSEAAGTDFAIIYRNGLPLGPVLDTPVQVVDVDMSIYDINDSALESATVKLTNASNGDQLNFDNSVLTALGISANIDNSIPGEITLTLSGSALLSNYETALKTVTYENTNPDASFDQITPRVIEFEISDGLVSTSGPQTTITFDTVTTSPIAAPDIYVADEDNTIIATSLTGLLANDSDPQGDAITIVSARDSMGVAITPLGAPHTTPAGASLTLNNDGSFGYIPAAHYSGTEYIEYTISDGVNTFTSWVTFDIQPVVDTVSLTATLADPTSDEDVASNPLVLTVSSPDSSETQEVVAQFIPENVVITDGVNSFRSIGLASSVDITNWDRNNIRVLPFGNTDDDISITFLATTEEIDGSLNFDTQTVTFQIDAVADLPILIATASGGPIDSDVPLEPSLAITLFDTDGSEAITDVTIDNIPAGGDILINGTPAPKSGNSVSFQLSELPNVVFRPPVTGVNSIYNLDVYATATEVAPENGVALATATTGPVVLTIDLNNNDDPVIAADDTAIASTGLPTTISVLGNDFIPDGGGVVTHINGTPIDNSTPYTLPGGEGVVALNVAGELVYTPDLSFSGVANFNYTLADIDGSTDIGDVQVTVQPSWNLIGDATANEGTNAQYQVELRGLLPQGRSASIDLSLADITTTSSDYQTFANAVDTSILANPDQGFSFDGTTLSYTSPIGDYSATYNPTGGGFADISGSGLPLGLGDDGISSQPLGFNFDFYGVSFDELFVSANGYITFGSPVDQAINTAIDGDALGQRPMIAAFWDNLGEGAGAVYAQLDNSLPGEGSLILQWDNVPHEDAVSGTVRFQMIIKESDGSIEIHYDDTTFDGVNDNGATASIGVQSGQGHATQHSFDTPNAVVAGSSITFERAVATNPTLVLDLPIISDGLFETAEDFRISLANPFGAALLSDQQDTNIPLNDNATPIVVDDAVSVLETATVAFNVLTDAPGADSDSDGHTISVTHVEGATFTDGDTITLASGALLTINSDGSFNYDPNGQFDALTGFQTATDSFVYTVTDQFGAAATGTVTVTINGENITGFVDLDDDGTTADRDTYTIYGPSDPSTLITAANAVVIDGDDTTFASVEIALSGFSQTGNEIITIFGEAVAFGNILSTTINVGGTILDLDYDGVNAISITDNLGGEISNADVNSVLQGIRYQNISGMDFSGLRTLTIGVHDGEILSQTAKAEIAVTGVNFPPDAVDDGAGTPIPVTEDTTVTILSSSLLANDSDPDTDAFQLISVQNAVNGTVTINGSGNVVFTPDPNYFGPASFQYTIQDVNFGQDSATVFLNVQPQPDAPQIDVNGSAAGTDYAATYQENGAAISMVASDATLVELDGEQIQSLTVTISGARAGDIYTHAAPGGGIAASTVPADAATGLLADGTVTITFSNGATAADYQAVLRSLMFEATGDNPPISARTASFVTSDGSQSSAAVTSTLTVQRFNDDPVTGADGPFATNEDTLLTIPGAVLLANDSDPDGDTFTLDSVSNPVNGSVSINGSGEVEFQPAANFFGSASFDYTIIDNNGGSATETVTLTVNSVNDAPDLDLNDTVAGTGNSDSYTENGAAVAIASVDVSLSDVEGDSITSATVTLTNGQIGDQFTAAGLPGGITASIVPPTALTSPGTIVVTLNGAATTAQYEAALQLVLFSSTSENPDTSIRLVDVSVSDGSDASNTATAVLTVIRANDAPIANADGAFVIAEDTPTNFAPALLLANDTDVDDDTLVLDAVLNPVNGTITINGSGEAVFTPTTNYTGAASFDYRVSDGAGGFDTTTVTINVVGTNDAPVLDLDDTATGTGYVTSYTENGSGVAVAGADIDLSDPDHANMTGATITITNGRVGDILTATGLPAGILATASPVGPLVSDGPLVLNLTGVASRGDYELALQAVFYSSNSDNPSIDDRLIDIEVNDGVDPSNTARTTIGVIAVNDGPTASGDGPFIVQEDAVLVLDPATLLANDTDPENDTLTLDNVQNPVNGSVTINGSGQVVFTPDLNFFGNASFEYITSDPSGLQSTALVQVLVQPVNDAATIDLDAGTIGSNYVTSHTEGAAATVLADSSVVLADVDDTQLESATIQLTNGRIGDIVEAGGLPGSITAVIVPPTALVADGTVTVTLTGPATLTDFEAALQAITYRTTVDNPSTLDRTFNIVVDDGDDVSSTSTTTVQVIGTNDAPVANDDGILNTLEDTTLVIAPALLTGNDSDPDDDPLTILSVQNSVNGTVTINGSGNVEFHPDNHYFGPASFEYTVSDGAGGTDTATVSINVQSVNDAPSGDLDQTASGSGFSDTYTENGPGLPIVDPTILLFDVDNANFASASIVLTNGQIGDILEVGGLPGTITASVVPPTALVANGTVTVTLTGPASPDDFELAIGAITYRSISEGPATVTRVIEVTASDGADTSSVMTSSIDVISVNDDPTANDDGPIAAVEDTPLNIPEATLIGNDTDPEGATPTIVSVQNPTNGTVSVSSGVVTFIPSLNYSGPASFEYTINDGLGGLDTALVTLNVAAVDDVPEIDLDSATTGLGYNAAYTENGTAIPLVDPSVSITDVDSANLVSASVVLTNGEVGDLIEVTGPTAGVVVTVTPSTALATPGSVTVTITGVASRSVYEAAFQTLTYRSTSEFPPEVDRLVDFTVNDGTNNSLASTTTIDVTAVNDVPVAGDDGAFATDEDVPLSLPHAVLLGNDSDLDLDSLTISGVSGAVNGTVVLNASTVVFTPDADYFGPASFDYTVDDGNGGTDTATVTVTVNPVNDAAIVDFNGALAGLDRTTSFTEGGTPATLADASAIVDDIDDTDLESASIILINGQVGDVLDASGIPGTISASVFPSGPLITPGSVTITLSGTASEADYKAAFEAITFENISDAPSPIVREIVTTANDGSVNSAAARTFITVIGVNDAPTANDDIGLSTDEDTPLVFNPLLNDVDVDGDALIISEINSTAIAANGSVPVANGVVTLDPDLQTLTFLPDANYFGPVSFSYTASDGTLTDSALVSITVDPVNDAPIVVDDGPVTFDEDTLSIFDPVTANDSDVEGDPLNISAIDGQAITPGGSVPVSNGAIQLGLDGRTLTFTPTLNFFGPTSIDYTVSDGNDTSSGTVTYFVSPVNDPITIASLPADQSLNDGQVLNLPMAQHFDDPDNDPLLYSASGLPVGLSINASTGVISGAIDSSASQTSPYTVSVSASDAISPIVSVTFQIDVSNVVPLAVSTTAVPLAEGNNFSIDPLDLFNDPDGDTLNLTISGLPAWAMFNGWTGLISGTVPVDAALFGNIVVSITADDGEGGSVSNTLTLAPFNVDPVARGQAPDLVQQEGDSILFNVGRHFVDGGNDTDTLRFSVSGLPDGLRFNSRTGIISGTLANGTGSPTPYVVILRADDGQGGVTTETFTIRVGEDGIIDTQSALPTDNVFDNTRIEPANPIDEAIDRQFIERSVNQFESLSGTTGLDAESGVLLSAVTAIDPLYEATLANASDGLPEQVEAMGKMAQSTNWLSSSGREGNGDWRPGVQHSWMGPVEADDEDQDEGGAAPAPVAIFDLAAYRRGERLFIEIKNNGAFDPKTIKVLQPDGSQLPEWMQKVRETFISAKPPEDVSIIRLLIVSTDENGVQTERLIVINPKTGESIELETKPQLPADSAQSQLRDNVA